jgi:antirestriction protein ArdC/phage/plasmid primase-like uncharacterized protein
MVKMNFRENVVNTLLDQMEAGTAPWQKPWEPGRVRQPSFNPATGKAYRGMNQVWLEAQGYADPRWVTYRQAQANGYQVRKGEKGTQIEFWQWSDRRPMFNDQKQPMLDANGKQRYQETRLDRPKVFHAVVFNGSQIDGLEPYVGHEPDFNPVERAENVLSNLNVPIQHDQRDRAFYHPGDDEIHMPPKGWFKGQYEYYATALHEGGHSTGHPSRLARNGGPFGSEDYAREELRAEIASYMMTTELGLGHYPERHAPYLKSWMSAIREDRNVLFQATRDAEVIRTWVMEPEKRLALTPVKEQRQEMAQVQSPAMSQNIGLSRSDKLVAERNEMVERMFETHPHAHPTLWSIELQDTLVLTGNRESNVLLSSDEIKEALKASDLSNDNLRRYLGQTAEAANWRGFAEIVPGYDEEFAEFAQLAEQFSKIDWVANYAASSERRLNGTSHREKVLEQMKAEASASPLHRERVSALWDLDGPGPKTSVPVPDWYVPSDQRKDDILKRLSKPFEVESPQPKQDRTYQIELFNREPKSFKKFDAAINEFVSQHGGGDNLLKAVVNGAEHTLIGNDWYNDGSNHRHTYLTPELEKLHNSMMAQRRQSDKEPAIIPKAEAEESIKVELDRMQRKSEEARLMANSPVEQAPKDEPQKKTYLSVPFREKNEAKSLGAKWDRRQKSWYVNEGTDLKPFAKWQQKIDTNEEKIDPKREFAAACQSEGLIIDEPMMDGKWHRVAVVGDAKGKTSGSYRGFIEGVPAGQIMNYKKASEAVKWVSTGSKVDPAEMERLKAQSAAKMAEQKQELQFKYKQVAKRAYGIFANAIDASNDHGYLKKKQVTGETLRVDQSGNLLVPMSNEKGFIENVQRIGPDGAKIYLKDGRKSGLMHIIPGKKNSPLIVAEGYATAKSLHAATGFSAVVAFDGGNLPVVAEALRKQNPDRQIVIAADDDHKQVEKIGLNPGLKAAERAAERSQAQILKPVLSADEKLQGLTDHNDLHVARGFDHFRRDVRSQLAEMGITAGRGQSMKITPKKVKSQSNEMSV